MAEQQPSGWRIEFYRTVTGEQPFLNFLRNLEGDHKDQADAMLTRLREHGNAAPRARLVETGLWELKGYQVRFYYVFRPGRRIVMLDGDVKKQDEIRQHVLKRLRAYRRDLESREEKQS